MKSSAPVPDAENPYRSPTAVADSRSEATSVDIFSTTAAFEVGEGEQIHDVRVTWSLWSGEEVYVVDDKEVTRMRSLGVSGVRELEVGKHKVEIRFRSLPFNVVEVYIDGKRHIRNLFPRLSLMLWTMAAVVCVPVGMLISWFLYTHA